MSILSALPNIVAGAVGGALFDAALIREDSPASDSAGRFARTQIRIRTRGLVEDYSDFARASGDIPVTDRKILLLGQALKNNPPIPGDSVDIEGRRYRVISVKRDPAGATYTIQGR